MSYLRTLLFMSCILVFISVDSQAQTTRRVPADHPTIQQAINASVNGDTVLVAPGTYFENIIFLGKAITVISEQGPAVTIIDGNPDEATVRFNAGEGRSSVLDGFTIRQDPDDSAFVFDRSGIQMFLCAPTIRNNIIKNNGQGIFLSGSSPLIQRNVITNNRSGGGIGMSSSSLAAQPQILDNTISNNTGPFGGGIDLFGAGDTLIRGNIISGNRGFSGGGIGIVGFSPVLIVQNLIINNSAFEGGGIAWLVPFNTPDPRIVNNTIANNDSPNGSGIFANGFDEATEVVNNIIVAKPGQTALFCEGFGDLSGPIIRFNNVFSPQGMAYGGFCPDMTGINGNISADPLFVDPANGDYHLQPDSPSVDAGTNEVAGLPTTDFDGDPRILDGDGDGLAIVDMGIDEVLPPGPEFDICIQAGGEILRINLETGDYQFTDCNGITLSGTGTLRNKGCTTTLQHNAPDRRIQAMINTCQNRGTATVQVLSPRRTFNLADLNITDGCGCN